MSFLASHHLFFTLFVTTVLLGISLKSTQGILCWHCTSPKNDSLCDKEHNGENENCNTTLNAMCVIRIRTEKDTKKKEIYKFCESTMDKTSGTCEEEPGTIATTNEVCYCNDKDLCNKEEIAGKGKSGSALITPMIISIFSGIICMLNADLWNL
ncbi:hypothetical protein Ocin01_10967 [Orchesella cincta]|uniref:Protein sleepless n=1 Tax=Orchesella cincta TaxID=48709 RepID=A0A1D2MS39_ORCCI|nr:hypothetical protein Ocin01_10967 [Orchesella cincta]